MHVWAINSTSSKLFIIRAKKKKKEKKKSKLFVQRIPFITSTVSVLLFNDNGPDYAEKGKKNSWPS
jgi:hypothetical protein